MGLRNTLHWSFELEEGDGRYTETISMIKNKFTTELPKGVNIDDIHPDHLALIALLVCHPFIHNEITIPWGVSDRFAESCSKISKYEVRFEHTKSQAYNTSNGRPALAFSGGADSTASLLVMPENTLSVFLDRPLKRWRSMYNKSGAYATIKHARKEGYEVLKLQCDVEYIRQPLGFATDLVPSIPIICLAASHNIDSVAFGTVMESAYRIGHEGARDYANSHHYRFWGRMFAAAGIPLYLPVAGVSEVGTSIIVNATSFYDYTRSCIRGEWPKSCEQCWKCFRKKMLDTKISGNPISEKYLQSGLLIPEVKKKMSAFPVSHENVLSWALSETENQISQLLKDRLEGTNRNLEFLSSFYPPSLNLIPEQHREETEKRLNHFLKPMKEEFWKEVTEHKMTDWLTSPSALEAKEKYDRFILEQSS
ncbi:MAG: DUF6395 domain-containing protein [Candidatus Thermoplasmatota archaeon]|nr:DUF6395 domain-containing protein [Candidatus Thermoplasmatota archaeon]